MGIVRAKKAGEIYFIIRTTSRTDTPRLMIISARNRNLSRNNSMVKAPRLMKNVFNSSDNMYLSMVFNIMFKEEKWAGDEEP